MFKPTRADSPTKTCTVEGCDRPLRARGMCASHYNQSRYVKPNPVATACAVCGRPVIRHVLNGRKPVCSYRCRGILQRSPGSPSDELVGPVPKVWPPEYRLPKLRRQRSRTFAACTCAWCGERFIQNLGECGGTIPRFCSLACSRNHHKAERRLRQGRFAISRRRRLAIYERDAWTCQLCHEPVDPSLSPEHRWAATLDHIECQSWALVPDHTDDNLRLAHRMCNSIRSDQPNLAVA